MLISQGPTLVSWELVQPDTSCYACSAVVGTFAPRSTSPANPTLPCQAKHTATHCNTLQHTATHCNNTLPCRAKHTATHCNTVQHTAMSGHPPCAHVPRSPPPVTTAHDVQQSLGHPPRRIGAPTPPAYNATLHMTVSCPSATDHRLEFVKQLVKSNLCVIL